MMASLIWTYSYHTFYLDLSLELDNRCDRDTLVTRAPGICTTLKTAAGDFSRVALWLMLRHYVGELWLHFPARDWIQTTHNTRHQPPAMSAMGGKYEYLNSVHISVHITRNKDVTNTSTLFYATTIVSVSSPQHPMLLMTCPMGWYSEFLGLISTKNNNKKLGKTSLGGLRRVFTHATCDPWCHRAQLMVRVPGDHQRMSNRSPDISFWCHPGPRHWSAFVQTMSWTFPTRFPRFLSKSRKARSHVIQFWTRAPARFSTNFRLRIFLTWCAHLEDILTRKWAMIDAGHEPEVWTKLIINKTLTRADVRG